MLQDNNNLRFGPREAGSYPESPAYTPAPEQPGQPVQEIPVQPQEPRSSGSYYSPRSGYPAMNSYPQQGPVYSAPESVRETARAPKPKKKKSHKVLKGVAVFAGIALLSYGSIVCYKYATQNKEVGSFLGSSELDEKSVAEQSSESSTSGSTVSAQNTGNSGASDSTVNATNWIDLAAREGAMSIPDIVDKVTPATVGVASTFTYHGQTYSMWGYGQSQSYEEDFSATGTGIIMSKNNDNSYYILTNAHVIYDTESRYQMGLATSVQVVLNSDYYSGETELDAKVVGYDTAEDIAVLRVTSAQALTVAEFGDSDDLRVGELVVAIGNPLGFDLFGSVTTGIVSALNREITINENTMNLIQTDTAINAGNSGGPLINSYGQVIGINSSKISSNYYDGSASVEGLCFAIPISHARSVVNDLINYGYVTGKPVIGISGVTLSEQKARALGVPVGFYVNDVTDGSAADLAGIQVGDVIIAVNGDTITTGEELNAAKDQFRAGDRIVLTVTRGGVDIDFTLILQELKPSVNE
ncbi:MAG: trypsin-like peptidase domain-containing protein [Oscillospiraceae bacterium]|nr:trypsin-like peptidase domain-containing protein [Oscillospiraceae bacterium]